jgi:hypothetical protein
MLYAAALDQRIGRLILDGMLLFYRTIIDQRVHRRIFENVVWGALRRYDLPDLVAALAPRPVWIANSVDALGHRVKMTDAGKRYEDAATAFRLAGAGNSLRIVERRSGDRAAAFYQDLK